MRRFLRFRTCEGVPAWVGPSEGLAAALLTAVQSSKRSATKIARNGRPGKGAAAVTVRRWHEWAIRCSAVAEVLPDPRSLQIPLNPRRRQSRDHPHRIYVALPRARCTRTRQHDDRRRRQRGDSVTVGPVRLMVLFAVSAPRQSVRAVCCTLVALHQRVVTDVD